jgi:hypothetical protein
MRPAYGDAARAAASFPTFLDVADYKPPRLRVLWVENKLDCRTWSYYCDLRAAMARLHDLCTPGARSTCFEKKRRFVPDVAVLGPRYTTNVVQDDETVGFDRVRWPTLPLAVVQNKMYAASTREIVGDARVKLRWVRAAGAAVAFTWLTRAPEFTELSEVPHLWLPFGVDAALYGRHAGALGAPHQPFDVGFTGASNSKYPLRQAILAMVRAMNVTSYLGTWAQTSLHRSDNRSWKALGRAEYAAQLARAKMWISTTGPDHIVGTRYFEVLASGTTLLMCNRPAAGARAYEGLFADGEHVVVFDTVDDLRDKILRYLRDEPARRRIVAAAAERVRRLHSWDARARFLTKAVLHAIARRPHGAPWYAAPRDAAAAQEGAVSIGCVARSAAFARALREQPVRPRRQLRWFTVSSCQRACGDAPVFAVHCGGFCSGNGHRWASCFCGSSSAPPAQRTLDAGLCATTCSLHDPRPCGGQGTLALYSTKGASSSLGRDAVSATTSTPRARRVLRIVPKDCGAGARLPVRHMCPGS